MSEFEGRERKERSCKLMRKRKKKEKKTNNNRRERERERRERESKRDYLHPKDDRRMHLPGVSAGQTIPQ